MFRPEYQQPMQQQQLILRDTVLHELIKDRMIKVHGVTTTDSVEDQISKIVLAVTLEIKRLSELCPKQPPVQPSQFIQPPVMQYPFGQSGFMTSPSFGVNNGFSQQSYASAINSSTHSYSTLEIDKVAQFLQNSTCYPQAKYIRHAITMLREVAKNEPFPNLENNSNLVTSLAFVITFIDMFNEIKSCKGIFYYKDEYNTIPIFKRKEIINNIKSGIMTDNPLALDCAAITLIKYGYDKVSPIFFGDTNFNKIQEMIRCVSYLIDDNMTLLRESVAIDMFTKELDTLLKYMDTYKYMPSEQFVKDSERHISQIISYDDFISVDKNKLNKVMIFMCELFGYVSTKSYNNNAYTYSQRLVMGVISSGLHLDGYEAVSKLGNIDTNNIFTSIHNTINNIIKYFKTFAETNNPPTEEQMKPEPSPSSEPKKEEKVEEEEKEVRVDIYGLDPAEVLARLWTVAKTEERYGNTVQELSVEDASRYLKKCSRELNGGQIYADYVEGKRIKIHMDNSIINTTTFDKEYGKGLANKVVNELRKEKQIYVKYQTIDNLSEERETGDMDNICSIYRATIVNDIKDSNSIIILNDPCRYKMIHRKGGFSFFEDYRTNKYSLAWSMHNFIKAYQDSILKYNKIKNSSYNHSSIDIEAAISVHTLKKLMHEIPRYEDSM